MIRGLALTLRDKKALLIGSLGLVLLLLTGILVASLLTLFVVPAAYQLLARRTGSPGAVRRRLAAEMAAGADSTPSRLGSAGP